MKVADDLRNGALDAEELIGKELVDFYWLVLVEPLGARIVSVLDALGAERDDHVVDPRMRKLGHHRIRLDHLQVLQERSIPLLRFASGTVVLNYFFKGVEICHGPNSGLLALMGETARGRARGRKEGLCYFLSASHSGV